MNPERQRGYIAGLRAAIVAALGGKCARCGEDDRRVLEIDHIHGGGTRHRKTHGGGSYYLLSIARQLDRYRLICANCSRIVEHHKRKIRRSGR